MEPPVLGLRASPARQAFKKRAGQNNHFLITVLVGLDAVREGTAGLPDEFSTSWSPHDLERSYARSREYCLNTSLAWITDLVDVYRKSLGRTATLFTASQASAIEDSDGRSAKLRAAAKVLGVPETPDELLVRLGIHWRNRIVHSDSQARLDGRVVAGLTDAKKELRTRHSGLDVASTIDRVHAGDAPTFKDVASIIAAAHQVVELMDAAALRRVHLDEYSDLVISEHLRSGLAKGRTNTIAQMWPGSTDKTLSRLTQVLLQAHMSPVAVDDDHVSRGYLLEIASLTPSEARRRFVSGPAKP